MNAVSVAPGGRRATGERNCGRRTRAGHTWDVGFNPYRVRRRSTADYLFVVAGILVTLALVAWAVLG